MFICLLIFFCIKDVNNMPLNLLEMQALEFEMVKALDAIRALMDRVHPEEGPNFEGDILNPPNFNDDSKLSYRRFGMPTTNFEADFSPEEGGYFEGDIILPKMKAGRKFNAQIDENLWPNKTMYYKFEEHYPLYGKHKFRIAAQDIMLQTCVRILEVYDSFPGPYITVKNSGMCASPVGFRDASYDVYIMEISTQFCSKHGTIVHEIMHVLGFWHEHTRTDRDKMVIFRRRNVNKSVIRNFYVRQIEEVQDLSLPYDYASVLHYRAKAFSYNNKLTLEPVIKGAETFMGQRQGMTALDVAKINRLYNCPNHYKAEEFATSDSCKKKPFRHGCTVGNNHASTLTQPTLIGLSPTLT